MFPVSNISTFDTCLDPFQRSMSLWLLKDYNKSLETLLVPMKEASEGATEELCIQNADIFNFYYYLRSHPLLRRRHLTQHTNRKNTIVSSNSDNCLSDAELQSSERKLYFLTACEHINAGLPDLALEVLTMLKSETKVNELTSNEPAGSDMLLNSTEDMIISGTIAQNFDSSFAQEADAVVEDSSKSESLDWGAPICNGGSSLFDPVPQTADSLDWGQPMMSIDFDEGYKIGITLDDTNDSSDSDEANKTESIDETDASVEISDMDVKDQNKKKEIDFDIVALNLKYVCIMKCLIEELKGLFSKCSMKKLKLRYALGVLLDKELDFLHQHCDYGVQKSEDDSSSFSISHLKVQLQG